MGLVFTVGRPSDVFDEPFAELVRHVLEAECEDDVDFGEAGVEPFHSSELGWSGWSLLQERARVAVPPEEVANLLSMDAIHGAYLPGWGEAGAILFDATPMPLDVAPLEGLIAELEKLGPALGLATDLDGLAQIVARYQDDDSCDDDMEIQTFAQLLITAREAARRRQPLWVVK